MEKGSAVLMLVAIVAVVLMLGVFALTQTRKLTIGPTPIPTPAEVSNSPVPTAGNSSDVDGSLKELDNDATNISEALKDQPVDVMSE